METATSGMPLVSVIITSYNYLHYIVQAIDSVLAQTYPNVEVVVTDNCSTDGTVPALRARYGNDPRVRIFENAANIGELRNSNRGFELTTGEFVAWLSADDFMFPRHLERLYSLVEHRPHIDVVYSQAYFADAAGDVYSQRMEGATFPFRYVDARDELVEMFTAQCPMCWPTALFRRSVFLEVGLEDPDGGIVGTDWEMQIRIALAEKRFAYLPEPSIAVRIQDGQTTGQNYLASDGRVRDFVGILEKYLDHPGMVRLRGREAAILGLLRWLIEESVRDGGPDVLGPEIRARVDAVSKTLQERADAYQPARVRESLISVLLPVSRSPRLAARAIASAAAQTFPNFEIVVIDHGSISLRDWIEGEPFAEHISYVRSPYPLTPGRARNLGLRMARGEYLAFLGEDNTYRPDHLSSLAETIVRNGSSAAAASSVLILEHAQPYFRHFQELGRAEIFRGPGDSADLSLVADALPLDALLVYRRTRDFGASFGEHSVFLDDYDYVLALERIEPIAFSGETTLEVRTRQDFSTALGAVLPGYVPILDAVYAAHPADHLAPQRAAHRAAVARAIAVITGGTNVTRQVAFDLLATLSGHTIRGSL